MAPPNPPPLLAGEPRAPDPLPLPPDVWLDRQPPLAYFVAWAKDNAPATRLRSLLGSPGIGKTKYLEKFEATLVQDSASSFLLPHLDLHPFNETRYRQWVSQVVEAAIEQGFPLTDPIHPGFRQAWVDVVSKLPTAQKPVLPLDGFDELSNDSRQFVEQHVLTPFLFAPIDNCQNRAVLARRDEYALNEAVLRWEDEVVWLKPLALDNEQNQPTDQIGRRLVAVAGQTPDAARRILEWPGAPDAAIAYAVGLNELEREALKTELTPALLINPFGNLLLLQLRLQRGSALISDDFHDCLKGYVSRARHGLPAASLDEWTAKLITFTQGLSDPASFKFAEDTPAANAELLREYQREGIIAQIPGTPRYRLDPVVVVLVRHI